MKKLLVVVFGLLLVLVPLTAVADSTADTVAASTIISQPVTFSSFKDEGDDNNIVIEKFIYNEKTGIPYTFDATIMQKDECVDVTDKINCSVSDESIIKQAGNNGIYAVQAGKSQVLLSYNGIEKIYNVEVIDPIPVRYRLDKGSMKIAHKWMTKLIQEYADMMDGTSIKINHAVKWESMNPDVATVSETGLVCAEGKGKTYITAIFDNTILKVAVVVLDSNVNMETQAFINQMEQKQIDQINQGLINAAITQTERQNIRDRASWMYNTTWTPTKNLKGWKDGFTFKAGTQYRGIPYSQHGFTDRDGTIVTGLTGFYQNGGFLYALANETNFYTSFNNGSFNMPRYGIDCSGYVSAAFKINRHTTKGFKDGIINGEFNKVGSYNPNNLTTADLLASYPLMQMADALVYRIGDKGHTFLVGNNYYSSCLCYEQTTYYTKLLWHDYVDLAADKYMPFSKK